MTQSDSHKNARYSKEGALTSALVRSIMEEEKPNQIEQFKIPKRSIARFFKPSATRDARAASCAPLSCLSKPRRAATDGAVRDGQRPPQGQGLLHLRREHHILRPRPLGEGQGDLLPDTLP